MPLDSPAGGLCNNHKRETSVEFLDQLEAEGLRRSSESLAPVWLNENLGICHRDIESVIY